MSSRSSLPFALAGGALVAALLAAVLVVTRTPPGGGVAPTVDGLEPAVRPEPRPVELTAPGAEPAPATPGEPAEARVAERSRAAPAPEPAPSQSQPQGVLVVRVLRLDTGAPIGGCPLRVGHAVVDRRGQPSMSWLAASRTRVDAGGEAEIQLPAGVDIQLLVGARGAPRGDPEAAYGSTSLRVEPLAPGERRTRSVLLRSGLDRLVWLTILAAEGGAPVADATVHAVGADDPLELAREPFPAVATSAADGVVELRVHSWWAGPMRVAAAGFAPVLFMPDEGHDSPDTALVLRLPRAAAVAARVVDGEDRGVADALVRVQVRTQVLGQPARTVWMRSRTLWKGRCDERGECALAGLPPGVPLTVEIVRYGLTLKEVPEPLFLAPGEDREVTWTVGPGATVRGRVLGPGGDPVAGARLWVRRREADQEVSAHLFVGFEDNGVFARAFADADGAFTFRRVPVGAWWVGLAPAGRGDAEHGLAPTSVPLDVRPGDREREVELRVGPALTLAGRVLDPEDRPASNVTILAEGLDLEARPRTRSGADGAFEIGRLAPGHYRLQAFGNGGWLQSEPLAAEAGETALVIRLRRSGVLGGLVVDPQGAPADAEVLLRRRGDDPRPQRLSAPGGEFRATGLLPGVYDLVAWSSGDGFGELSGVTLAGGGRVRDLRVVLAPAGRLVVTQSRAPVAHAQVTRGGRVLASELLPAGVARSVTVPPGKVAVSLELDGAVVDGREVEVAAGAETPVRFEP